MATTNSAAVFKANLEKAGPRWRETARLLVNGLTFKVYEAIVTSPDHPVDTGRARAGWAISAEVPGEFLPSEGTHGAPSSTLWASSIAGSPLGAKRIIYNNVEYVFWLEEGSENMAGRHFVKMAVQGLAARAAA